MDLHIFNPWHDDALASNSAYFVPAGKLRIMGENLAQLPLSYTATTSIEILKIPQSLRRADFPRINWAKITTIQPWGWNVLLRRLLLDMNAPESLLPSIPALQQLRTLSSRATCTKILQWINTHQYDFFGKTQQPLLSQTKSFFCQNTDDVQQALALCGQKVMVKRPWSSSGRGVFPLHQAPNPVEKKRILKCLYEQGGIEIQNLEEGLLDIAMEFYCNKSQSAEYEGIACFLTKPGGSYQGNIVASPTQLLHFIHEEWQRRYKIWWQKTNKKSKFPLSDFDDFLALLEQVRNCLTQALNLFVSPYYTGPVGIDLLLTPQGLHPCVEINLRNTMGRVALHIAKKTPNDSPRLMLPQPHGLEWRTLV